MPRQLRIRYAGAVYHVTSRGDRREDIFSDDVDRQDFLKTLAEAGQKTGWQVHAHCPEWRLEARRLEPGDEQGLKALRRGWCLGSEEFKQRVLAETESQLGEHHFGRLRQETAEARAQRIIGEELGRLGWEPTELGARRESDPAKLQIAVQLRRETTLSGLDPFPAIAGDGREG